MSGMRHLNAKRLFIRLACAGLGASTLFLASCESKVSKKSAKPSVQVLAPTQQQPTPAAPTTTPTPSSPEQAQIVKKPDAAAQTIAEAEKSFEAGQTDYKAGHLDAA